jgi:hypothetical protein
MIRCVAWLRVGMLQVAASVPADAQVVTPEQAMGAAIHAVSTEADMRSWLGRVPVTRQFPPDLVDALRGQSSLYLIEMTTAHGCLPCADLWGRLGELRRRFGWQNQTINGQDAMLRSGRLGSSAPLARFGT